MAKNVSFARLVVTFNVTYAAKDYESQSVTGTQISMRVWQTRA